MFPLQSSIWESQAPGYCLTNSFYQLRLEIWSTGLDLISVNSILMWHFSDNGVSKNKVWYMPLGPNVQATSIMDKQKGREVSEWILVY